jgi:hypothetical protein
VGQGSRGEEEEEEGPPATTAEAEAAAGAGAAGGTATTTGGATTDAGVSAAVYIMFVCWLKGCVFAAVAVAAW